MPTWVVCALKINTKVANKFLWNGAFRFKNGKKRYEYIVVGHNSAYFVKSTSNAKNEYTEDNIVRMLDFLIDNFFC